MHTLESHIRMHNFIFKFNSGVETTQNIPLQHLLAVRRLQRQQRYPIKHNCVNHSIVALNQCLSSHTTRNNALIGLPVGPGVWTVVIRRRAEGSLWAVGRQWGGAGPRQEWGDEGGEGCVLGGGLGGCKHWGGAVVTAQYYLLWSYWGCSLVWDSHPHAVQD